MNAKQSALVLVLLSALLQLDAKPFTLYVATNGNDQWSGRLASPAADSRDGPQATLAGALRTARQARQTNAAQAADGIAILLRGGTHVLSAPVELTPEDSGASAKAPLIIAAYESEKPILSGGTNRNLLFHGGNRA